MPKVSVVLTSFNHGKYIREAIDSVLNQTFADFELIIWDDASSDDSWEIITGYSDSRIRAFRNDVNKRPLFGVNKAISEVAVGEYVAMNHSDDVWEPEKLERQVAFLERHPEIGAVFSSALVISEDGSPLAAEGHYYFKIFNQPNRTRYEWLGYFFEHGNALCHPSVLIRKSCYEDSGLYRKGLAQSGDFNLWVRLCMKHEIHVMPEKLVRFRVRDNEANTSGSRPESRIRGVYEYYKLFELFLTVDRPEDLFKIFPSMRRYDRGGDTDVEFVLAMAAFEGNTFCTKQLFGLDILWRIIGNPARSKAIEDLYGFTANDFIALTGKYDVFSREEVFNLVSRVQTLEGDIRTLEGREAEIGWPRNAVAKKSGFSEMPNLERDDLLGDISRLAGLLNGLSANWNEAQIYLHSVRLDLAQTEAALEALRRTKVFRLREVLLHHPWGARKILHIAYLVVALLTPRFLRTAAAPLTIRLRQMAGTPARSHAGSVADGEPGVIAELEPAAGSGLLGELDPVAQSELAAEYGDTAYVVRKSRIARIDAPKIVHVIANFMTGGSSRLVVDLIEYLGSEYRQSVITSFIPDPPAYVGLEIEECRAPENELPFVEYFQRVRPDFVHVHYWGESDEPWYAKAILAAEHLGLPVIENINTPIAPYLSEAVARYVYVSDYARRVFGQGDPRHITIYPGSNFSRFDRGSDEPLPENCVGMVYRLERDKLNERSIEPFIRIAQRRPQTRILIVGGGSLLEPFQEAVRSAGVSQSFEFTGYVGYEELPDLYRRMTVFVAPVWKESFGQVSPFAMNMRVPVVGYGVGAIGEIVEAPELLAPPGDAEKLADIVIGLLDNRAQRERIGEMQRDRAEANFSVQAMIRSYAKIYAEMSGR